MTAPFISKAPVYAVGTASMTNGSAVVAFAGANLIQTDPTTGLQASVVTVGDMLVVPGLAGGYGIIQSIDSASQVTLATPWAVATQSGVAYAVYRYATPASGVALAAFNAATTLGQDSNPVASQAVDDGTARIKIKVVSGQPTIAVGAAGAADAALIPAIAVNKATGAVSFLNGATSPVPVDHNPISNSAFDIWQRGGTFNLPSNSVQSVADRWFVNNSTTVTAAVTKMAAPSGFHGYSAINIAATGANATGYIDLRQRFEGQIIQHLDSVPSVLSFDLQASTSGGTLGGLIFCLGNTALDNGTFNVGINGGGISFTIPVGVGRVSVPVPASLAVGMKLGCDLYIRFNQNGATGNPNITVGAVQWDIGPVAQPFMPRQIDREWVRCLRYYQTGTLTIFRANQSGAFGGGYSSWMLPTSMRATPSVVVSNFSGTVTASPMTRASSILFEAWFATAGNAADYEAFTYQLNAEINP